MKSRIAKLATAAVIVVTIVLFGLWTDFGVSSKVYGMSDAIKVIQQARTIRVTGWSYLSDYAMLAEKEDERDDIGCCIDLQGRRVQYRGYGFEYVTSGQYEMKINGHDESVTFYRLTDFQREMWVRAMWGWNFDWILMTDEELSEFVKVGEELVDGSKFDIWERKTEYWYPSEREIRRRYWVSPESGKIKRYQQWEKGEFTGEKWCLSSEKQIEIDIVPPEEVFDMVPPEGYALRNTIETAIAYEFCITSFRVNGNNRAKVAISLTLPNGIVILGWYIEGTVDYGSRAELFEGLEVGLSLPTLPVEVIYGLTPRNKAYRLQPTEVTYEDRSVVYAGRHLAYTQKNDKLYEWAIYIPNKEVDGRKLSHRCEIVVGLEYDNPHWWVNPHRYNLYNNSTIIEEDEFDTFVRGAMADLSDSGLAPEHVTYDNVLNLADEIRESMGQ